MLSMFSECCMVQCAGLTKLVDQTKAFKLHDEEGLVALSRLLTGLHKLVEHPHDQVHVHNDSVQALCVRSLGLHAPERTQQLIIPHACDTLSLLSTMGCDILLRVTSCQSRAV